ncbi:hypothetical protein QDY71_09610 [Kingella negevensis]|uniref:Uncharacterized protein n=1 Tax=Kingella negevensis TaxID=1522312 RepID=A0A238HIY5_9NEIS|nr:hypothetical protein [Kingella negevensis]MDK4685297.1 hypothetical protein [Kingella negevensis]MDK4697997.1 hypothetical protein [Kingella negevensis]MDK4707255.1 hypothetical protein [Kingella negevensis]MDK4710267.1 hypothetical protein [Kingella negevensis]SNB80547.1 Uncharacterised protein [Kingella negevensis]
MIRKILAVLLCATAVSAQAQTRPENAAGTWQCVAEEKTDNFSTLTQYTAEYSADKSMRLDGMIDIAFSEKVAVKSSGVLGIGGDNGKKLHYTFKSKGTWDLSENEFIQHTIQRKISADRATRRGKLFPDWLKEFNEPFIHGMTVTEEKTELAKFGVDSISETEMKLHSPNRKLPLVCMKQS